MSLLEEIRALPADVLAACGQDTQKIAKAVSEGRTALIPGTLMGEGLVWAQLGFEAGSVVLDKFEALADQAPIFVRPLRQLQAGRLDIGIAETRRAIGALVPSIMTAEQYETLLAPGIRSAPVSELDVRDVAWSRDGKWMI